MHLATIESTTQQLTAVQWRLFQFQIRERGLCKMCTCSKYQNVSNSTHHLVGHWDTYTTCTWRHQLRGANLAGPPTNKYQPPNYTRTETPQQTVVPRWEGSRAGWSKAESTLSPQQRGRCFAVPAERSASTASTAQERLQSRQPRGERQRCRSAQAGGVAPVSVPPA